MIVFLINSCTLFFNLLIYGIIRKKEDIEKSKTKFYIFLSTCLKLTLTLKMLLNCKGNLYSLVQM